MLSKDRDQQVENDEESILQCLIQFFALQQFALEKSEISAKSINGEMLYKLLEQIYLFFLLNFHNALFCREMIPDEMIPVKRFTSYWKEIKVIDIESFHAIIKKQWYEILHVWAQFALVWFIFNVLA